MKKLFCIALAIILVLSLCGCGSVNKDTAMNGAATTPMAPAPYPEVNYGWDGSDSAIEEPAGMPEIEYSGTSAGTTANVNASIPANVKLIYTASIDMESTAFDTAVTSVQSLVESCGGYFESSDLNNYSAYRYASYTVRVPADKFDYFCSTISQMSREGDILQVNNISRNAKDVSEYYYDTESRLATQQTKLERLQELLAKAENMEDIISLECAISDTELVIENLTGTLRHYDSLVGYSTISLYLNEVYKLSEVEEPVIGFGAKLAAAFKTGCSRFVDNLQYSILDIARDWVSWLIFVAVVVVVIVLAVRFTRRRKSAKLARREKAAAAKNDEKEKE